MRKLFFYGTFLATGLFALAASAASPVSHVGSAQVNEGESSIEIRSGYTTDDSGSSSHKRVRLREFYDHAFNDWYALRLLVEQDKRQGDGFEHQNVAIYNRFQIFERSRDGWDGGIRLNYGHSDGDKTPHGVDLVLLAQVPVTDDWEWRHNMVWEHDIGPDSDDGLALELRNQVMRKVTPPVSCLKKFSVGAEMFNDFGNLRTLSGYDNQDHQIGPVMKGNFDNGYFFQAGYRAGISEAAPDHLFKLSMGRKF